MHTKHKQERDQDIPCIGRRNNPRHTGKKEEKNSHPFNHVDLKDDADHRQQHSQGERGSDHPPGNREGPGESLSSKEYENSKEGTENETDQSIIIANKPMCIRDEPRRKERDGHAKHSFSGDAHEPTAPLELV